MARRLLFLIALFAFTDTALAQTPPSCIAPANLPRPKLDGPDKDQPVRRIPIASYTLALSWSPQYCRGGNAGKERLRCNGRLARFGFTLHGLWPDGAGTTWPQYCRPAALLPSPIIRQNICATPSVDLVQHEWAKHGTCMTTDPTKYFNEARALYDQVKVPDMDGLSRRRTLTIGAFVDAFVAVNPAIPARAVRVTTTRGNWLDELWLCLDKQQRWAPCKVSQDGGNNPRRSLRIWRGR
jgi:ribonuclease T2